VGPAKHSGVGSLLTPLALCRGRQQLRSVGRQQLAALSSSSPRSWRCGRCDGWVWLAGEWTGKSAVLKGVRTHAPTYQMEQRMRVRAVPPADGRSHIAGRPAALSRAHRRVTRSQRAEAQALCESQLNRGMGDPDSPSLRAALACCLAACDELGELRYTHAQPLPSSPDAICTRGRRMGGSVAWKAWVYVTSDRRCSCVRSPCVCAWEQGAPSCAATSPHPRAVSPSRVGVVAASSAVQGEWRSVVVSVVDQWRTQ
jgi:hypothetical protein